MEARPPVTAVDDAIVTGALGPAALAAVWLLATVGVARLAAEFSWLLGPAAPRPPARTASEPRSASFAVACWMVLPWMCLRWVDALWDGDLSRAPWLAGAVIVLIPWPLATRVAVPLGLWRTAYALARLSCWTFRGDARGAAVLAGMWALLHRRRDNANAAPQTAAKAVAWLLARRDKATPLRGGAILASALAAEIRGDRATMLQLTRSVVLLAPDPRHAGARGLAAQWLAADAASRGDWATVRRVTGCVRALPPGARLLCALAHDTDGPPRGRAWLQLCSAWLVAPHRRATWPLLRNALRRGHSVHDEQRGDATDAGPYRRPRAGDDGGEDPGGDSTVAPVVAAHAELLGRPAERIDDAALRALAERWARTLASPTLRAHLAARAEAIGARRAEPLLQARDEVVQELAAVLRRRNERRNAEDQPGSAAQGEPDDEHELPALLAAARATLAAEAVAEVESRWAPIRQRQRDGTTLPAIDEWREFVLLTLAHRTAISYRGRAGRHLLFDDLDVAISNLAARLWNDRNERSIAHAMFAWLLTEAQHVGDTEAIERLTANLEGNL